MARPLTGRQDLTGTIAGGAVAQVPVDGTIQLGNRSDAIILIDANGRTIDQVAYKADILRAGRTICFGR